MSTEIDQLYRMKLDEGVMTWDECNRINAHLARLPSERVPSDQVSNVCEYLESVLFWQSALPVHRESLAKLLTELNQVGAKQSNVNDRQC